VPDVLLTGETTELTIEMSNGSQQGENMKQGRRRRWIARLAGIAAVVAVGLVLLNGARLMDRATGWWVGGQISDAVSRTGDGEVLDLVRVYDADWDRAVWVGPYVDGAGGNEMLGFRYFSDDEILSADDTVSRLLFVRGTDVLADVELHRVWFSGERSAISPGSARFAVWRDSIGWTLDPAASASR
jgi:hypothetical protein